MAPDEKQKHREIFIDEDFPRGSLVLTRKLGEGVRITMGDIDTDVTVVKIKGRQVRLAVRAPKEYGQIDRITYSKLKEEK